VCLKEVAPGVGGIGGLIEVDFAISTQECSTHWDCNRENLDQCSV
jgi:hypothetical protein